MGYLNALVGAPMDGDVIVGAIPVCAPYSALSAYKFKAKLIPGTGKRGKGLGLYFLLLIVYDRRLIISAAKAAVSAFSHQADVTSHEKDMFRAVKVCLSLLFRLIIPNVDDDLGRGAGTWHAW